MNTTFELSNNWLRPAQSNNPFQSQSQQPLEIPIQPQLQNQPNQQQLQYHLTPQQQQALHYYQNYKMDFDFLLTIINRTDQLSNKTYLFADDTKMVSAINPAIAIADSLSLQNDIDSAFRWASTWLMQLNPTNYKVMHLGKRNPNLNYSVLNQENTTRLPLESTSHERDLEIVISSNLKQSLQCKKAAAKASSM